MRKQEKKPTGTPEQILVCLSPSPSNARIIRTAARMAEAFGSELTALFVETPDYTSLPVEDRRRLAENEALAKQFGAKVEVVFGDNVAHQIAEFARVSGATRIVLGRSATKRRLPWSKPTLMEQLLSNAPDVDIHIIPDQQARAVAFRGSVPGSAREIALNVCKSLAFLAVTTLISNLFYRLHFANVNLILVYILGVLLTSVVTSSRLYSLIAAIASVLLYNFLFVEPRFSMAAYEAGYPVTFVVMFLTAFISSTLAIRYKVQAGQASKTAHRTRVLYDADQMLVKAESRAEIFRTAGEHIQKLLDRDTVVYENRDGEPALICLFPAGSGLTLAPDGDCSGARWALEHNDAAGATTEVQPELQFLYLPIHMADRIYGVLGVEAKHAPLEPSERSILLSLLGEVALALENEKNAREKEAAAVQAQSEELRANLLRSISHDLRTPLTTISGNAYSLVQGGESYDTLTRSQIYRDIYQDAQWLYNLVENLLYATRIEDGRMNLRTGPELVSELFEETEAHLRRNAGQHLLSFDCPEELLMVRADARLVIQILVNLTDNAFRYTPADAAVCVSAKKAGEFAEIRVADNGPGIPDAEKAKVFEKFYSGKNCIADNRRSLGLGLYLCKVIVEAHGGTICLTDNTPHGAVFSFTLPLEEVPGYESI